MNRSLVFLFFLSASVCSISNLAEEQLLLKKSGGNGTEEQGSGEEAEQVLIVENSTSSEFPSSTVHTTFASSSDPPKPIRCYDISKKCKSIEKLCDREEYRTIMIRQCAWTCKACDEFSRLPHHARCRDSFHSCPIWADNGFCHSTYYTLDERKSYCRRSCEDC